MSGRKHKSKPGKQPQASAKVASAPSSDQARARGYRRFGYMALLVLAIVGALYTWWAHTRSVNVASNSAISERSAGASFVGAKTCAACHSAQNTAWLGSQHAKAMQHATADTVLGDFNNARFSYNGIMSTFFRRDAKFFVTTDGADGKLADFEILYTFGLYPLQQYLVAFPDGRMQALSIAWDARPKEQGGGRWFHLNPNEHITYKDPLHWTRLNQNWNWMCADCHTTKLERNYNFSTNTYATTWQEMNVACEACHGPGSIHVAWATRAPGYDKVTGHGLTVALDEREGLTWSRIPATGNSVRSAALVSEREVGVCAQCHSRRSAFAAGMNHDGRLFDTHDVALLSEYLYFPDGQQREEVYDVGSFLQSKMHAHGVTCSDCHDPHSAELRAPGNAVCAQCHSESKFNVPAHTLHQPHSSGAQCAACHMPTRTYMGIDPRHDHSIRIPRPDLSEALGTPNACTGCHENRTASWAAGVIAHAFGPERKGFQTFGGTLHDGRSGAPGAMMKLVALANDAQAPGIVRATAVADLRPYLDAKVIAALEKSLTDPDAMVRGAALGVLLAASPEDRVRLALGLIDDRSAIVRIKAGRALAIMDLEGSSAAMRGAIEKVFGDYVVSQRANADRPEAHLNLGLFYLERRDPAQSEAEYRAALSLQSDFAPAYVNLADLYRAYDRDADGEAILASGLRAIPDNADLLHALGLLRVRQKRTEEALQLLGAASRADLGNPRYAYVYGIALHDSGERRLAIQELEHALARFPRDPDLLSSLSAFSSEVGDKKRAQMYSKRLSAVAPHRSP